MQGGTHPLLFPQSKLSLSDTILITSCCLRATINAGVSMITTAYEDKSTDFGFFFLPGLPAFAEPGSPLRSADDSRSD